MTGVAAAPSRTSTRRYELRVASVLGPSLVSSFGHTTASHAVGSHTLYRFCVPGDRDLLAILRLLGRCGVECVAIRPAQPGCPEPADRPAQPATPAGLPASAPVGRIN